ncbi:MAG: MOSC domain-containing protein [Deltaproteobacteria bacterium]|nr:MOSC domain-containing protein [Deltaproteobacteria bacterium]
MVGTVLAIARKPRHGAPMVAIDGAAITTERGLEGNANGRPGRRQLTVLTREGWEAACRVLGREVPWTTRRANVLVEGLELVGRVGWRLTIGAVMLEITGETTPCSRMDAQVAGLTAALAPEWRAGVTCRVLQGGEIGRGDAVTLEPP